MKTFSLCHTTARLPRGWIRAYEDWMKKADRPFDIEYILAVDADRVLELDHPRHLPVKDIDRTQARLVVNHGRKSAAIGWNAASEASTGRFLISVADDWFPPEHWDTELLEAIPSLDGEYVLDVDNSEGSYPLLPFSLMTRAYYDRLRRDYGYAGFFYPEYFGFFADCEFTDLARQDRVVVNARHLKFEHRAPAAGTAEWVKDGVYGWQARPEAMDTGKRVYMRRIRELGIRHPGFIPLDFRNFIAEEALCS